MTTHPRYQYKPEDLFLTVFVYIDDWLKPYQSLLPQQPTQKASYSELQGRRGPPLGGTRAASKDGFFGLELRVPKLPHYSRYHRISRNAERLVAKLALSVLGDDRIHLIDSKPLPVADPKSPLLGKRSSWSKFPEARKGFSTMGMVFGFKLHALTSLDGLFARWAFAAAHHTDVTRTQRVRL